MGTTLERQTLYYVKRTPGLVETLSTLTLPGGNMRRVLNATHRTTREQRAIQIHIVRDGDTVVGWTWSYSGTRVMVGGKPVPGARPYIHTTYFFVHPDYRRKGVGTLLMTAVLAWAKRNRRLIQVIKNTKNADFFDKFLSHPCIHVYRPGIDIW